MKRRSPVSQFEAGVNFARTALIAKAGVLSANSTSSEFQALPNNANSASYVFYKLSPQRAATIPPAELTAYEWLLWTPGVFPPHPVAADAAWAAMHHLRVFSNQSYCRVFAYDRGRVVHRLTVFPKWLRYPFMADEDVQIGNVWTDDSHRGRGLATAGIKKAVLALAAPGRSFWYVTTKDNLASRAAAEHSGFEQFGWGERTERFGLRLLGAFEIKQREVLPEFSHPPLLIDAGIAARTQVPRAPVELIDSKRKLGGAADAPRL